MADLERSTAAAPAHVSAHPDIESLPALFGRLGDDVMTLVDTKLSLLKVEVKEDAEAYARAGAMMAVGGVIAAVGFAFINVAVAFFVATLLQMYTTLRPPVSYALGFIITGAIYLIIGGIIIMVVKGRMARRNPVPEQSVEELRKDKQWLKKDM